MTGRLNGCNNVWMDGYVDECQAGWKNKWKKEWMNCWIDRWLNGWLDE
jgi:hypothetical protein